MATKSGGDRNREHNARGTPEGRGGGGARGNADRGRGSDKSSNNQPGNMLDKILGYNTVQERVNAYANNPNRPNYNTKTMGVPIAQYGATPMSLMSGQNLGMTPEASAALSMAMAGMTGINAGMGLTRAIQAATGMSGGPAIGGREDGMGAFGGGPGMGGRNNAGQIGYQLPQGYMSQPQTPQPPIQPQLPASSFDRLNQPSKYLSPTPGYGVNTPAYSYFGPMKR